MSREKLMTSEGELAKRLRIGFEQVVENVVLEGLSVEGFEKALPKTVDAEEIRNALVGTFKENAFEALKTSFTSSGLKEKLNDLETLLGPVVKNKRYPILRQSPKEIMTNLVVEKKMILKKELEEKLSIVEKEISEVQSQLEGSRVEAKKLLRHLEHVQNKCDALSSEQFAKDDAK